MPPENSKIIIPQYAKERHKLTANTHRLMENYKDDYESHAKGIFQEAIQNSIDAKISDYSEVKITIKYDPQKRILSIRDYGTTGMSYCKKCYWGRIEGSEDCHADNCDWGNFHFLGGLSKAEVGSLGSRGQGKSLIIIAGIETIVRTKIANPQPYHKEISMASKWTRTGNDWEWSLVEDSIMKSNEQAGTEIIVNGVIDSVHEELMNSDVIIQNISKTWCGAIKKGVQIRFGYVGKDFQKIGMPQFPPIAMDNGKKIVRKIQKIPISVHRKKVGQLNNVTIVLAEEPVPKELRGIALLKNGTQVISREIEFGRKISTELQDRIYGWASYDCNHPGRFLCSSEKPGHRGFQTHTYYTKVQSLLQEYVEDFLLPYEKKRYKPHLTEKDVKRAQQNLDVLQKAFEEVPDFNPWSGSDEITTKRKTKEPHQQPYISSIKLDKGYYLYDQNAIVEIVILNPTSEYQKFLHLTVEALDKGLSQLRVWEYPPHVIPLLNPATPEKEGRITYQINIPIIDEFGIGKNFIRCTLRNRPPNIKEAEIIDQEYDRASHSIWIEAQPVLIPRSPPTAGLKGDDGRKGTVRDLVPLTDEALDPIQNEIMPIWRDGEFWFFTKGARIGYVYETQPRAADSILYELVAEVLAEKRLKDFIETNPQDNFDKDQVIQQLQKIEELRRKFLRTCEKLRATSREG